MFAKLCTDLHNTRGVLMKPEEVMGSKLFTAANKLNFVLSVDDAVFCDLGRPFSFLRFNNFWEGTGREKKQMFSDYPGSSMIYEMECSFELEVLEMIKANYEHFNLDAEELLMTVKLDLIKKNWQKCIDTFRDQIFF